MNESLIINQWPTVCRALERRFPYLSEQQLTLYAGHEQESLKRIRQLTGLSPVEFEKFATDAMLIHS